MPNQPIPSNIIVLFSNYPENFLQGCANLGINLQSILNEKGVSGFKAELKSQLQKKVGHINGSTLYTTMINIEGPGGGTQLTKAETLTDPDPKE